MASLRKGRCYSKVKRPYTRKSKFRKLGFIKAVPNSKISRYQMGDQKKKFDVQLKLTSNQAIQIRHNAIESVRQIVNRHLHTALGLDYDLRIQIFPHHVLRENKMLAGAGADRMQTGMQRAFGKAVGIAARVKKGQTILSLKVSKDNTDLGKTALKKAIHRLPGKYQITEGKIKPAKND